MLEQNSLIPGWVAPDFWSGKTVGVTGGTGFLGKHLIALLKKLDINFNIYDSRKVNLLDPLETIEVIVDNDIIIHLAGVVGGIGFNKENPYRLFYDNFTMGYNLINSFKEWRNDYKKLVLMGTICSFPRTPKTIPFIEEELFDGYPEETNAPYGIAKRTLWVMADAYSRQLKNNFQINSNIIYLMPTNLTGEYDHFEENKSHVIPAMIKKFVYAKWKGMPSVELWGTGKASREFLYAGDCAKAILMATQNYNDISPVNIGTGEEITIRELAETIRSMIEYDCEIIWNDEYPDGQPRRCLNTEKAYKLFGFKAETSFKEMLSRTINWYCDKAKKE